jgi:hypothetical protein
MGIQIKYAPLKEMSSNPDNAIEVGDQAPRISVPKSLENDAAYYGALHELGHHATWEAHPIPKQVFFSSQVFGAMYPVQLDNEAAATQWANDNAGETIPPEGYFVEHAALTSYLNGWFQSNGDEDPPALFREVFNRTAEGMNGSSLTSEDLRKQYKLDKEMWDFNFAGSESSALI